ncbi:CDP-alcohol phosphatidyltransferase family protein [Kribbella deserti]|uniref:CDP-alcohol phosphatidyltransferase family protein n=1 Tax=Kribbella deserti TaxID=1926257 RepID=A0ABV6QME9_9ACTN
MAELEVSDRVLTIPNALSVLRLLGVPVFLWLILGPQEDGWAIVVLMISGFTDWADGQIARRMNQTTRLGQMLDPVADRLYIFATVLGLALRDIIPWWLAIALPLRDLLLTFTLPVLHRRGFNALPVHFLGKAATFNLLYAFPLLLLGDGDGTLNLLARVFGWAFAIWGTALYYWAGALYFAQLKHLVETVPPLSKVAVDSPGRS